MDSHIREPTLSIKKNGVLTNQCVCVGVELLLEADDDDVHLLALTLDVRSNLENVKCEEKVFIMGVQ